jgi:hypothetical protein
MTRHNDIFPSIPEAVDQHPFLLFLGWFKVKDFLHHHLFVVEELLIEDFNDIDVDICIV